MPASPLADPWPALDTAGVAARLRAEAAQARRARRRLMVVLAAAAAVLLALGLLIGSEGWSWAAWRHDLASGAAGLLVGEIRAPRTLGALLVGALLGLGGALAQGLFRNPLAEPYLIGSASGASLAVVAVLALGGGAAVAGGMAGWLARLGVVGAAFCGALAGVLITLALARGAQHTLRLLLAGVVVGVMLGAASDLLSSAYPQALAGKQAFLLGSTAYVGWPAAALLAGGLVAALALALRFARVLDALTLGEAGAASLGLDVPRLRLLLVGVLALCTALAVSQAGLVAFVGLVAPHLVRRQARGPHAFLLGASAAMGGVLLLAADVLARSLVAPQELPVGVLTAMLGGTYLVVLLWRRGV